MGCKPSRSADEQHLLDNTDDETVPLLENINVVLIGCNKAGKNTVANAILGKKAFTHMNAYTEEYLKHKKTIFGRCITVIRVPGWSGSLSSGEKKQENLRQTLKDSVKSFKHGPNAIILVVKMGTDLSGTTRSTLETLLGASVSEHTLIFSMDGSNISVATISEHYGNKKTIIETCTRKYYFFWRKPCREQHMKLIETIEDFIAGKNAINFCPTGKEEPKPELQIEQLKTLVNRLNQKISALSGSISKLQRDKKIKTNELRKQIESKNEEIRKLQGVLKQKEKALNTLKNDIERIRPSQSPTELSVLRRITQLENEGMEKEKEFQKKMKEKEQQIEEKNAIIKSLKEENQKLKNTLNEKKRKKVPTRKAWRKTETTDELELAPLHFEDATSADEEHQTRGEPHHELHRDFLCGWTSNLNNILNELNEDQFKIMKNLLGWRVEWRIPAGKLDGKDRASLTKLLVQTWGEYQCIINTRDIMKEIPRNDKVIQDLFVPFLEHFGEKW